jgi:DHA1 family multidrug resistance protein-like MFS transporter
MSETTATTSRASQSWVLVLVLFSITSMVEAIGVSQVFAFMPLYLQQLGLPGDQIPRWVGTISALVFVLGLPMVPFWGVWADKYSRKAVIIRSSAIEALVFGLVAVSREPWQLAASFMLSGFQLGNTGVMLAAIRDVTPQGRIGTAMAIFGATSPIGFAVGPALGGFMADGLGLPLWTVYASSSFLSLVVCIVLGAGFREVRPGVVPTGSMLQLAFGAVRGVFTDPATRRLFALFGVSFLSRQMATPFLPLVVQHAHGTGPGLASSVALVVGTAALIGGLISPLGGAVGDRVGFRPVLFVSLLVNGVLLALMPFAPDTSALALVNAAFAALTAVVGAMIFGLLAMEVPPERRSATLNLVYLPLYLAGIAGPAIGGVVAAASVSYIFVLAGLVSATGSVMVAAQRRRTDP